jgi:hypothetical protein
MRQALLISFIITCVLSSCIKAPEYSIIPAIKFVSVSSQYVTSGSLDTITFSFTDGDGDIAPNNNYPSLDTCIVHGDSTMLYKNYNNIFLFASNNNFGCQIPDAFASPNLVPSGSYKALSGQIQVYEAVHSSTCLLCADSTCINPNGTTGNDSVIYTIYLVDLAGHLSNPIKTTAIYTGCR